MTSNAFLEKIIAADYGSMELREYEVMDGSPEVFNLGSKFSKALATARRNGPDLSDESRAELMGIIEEKVPPALFVLNRLDNYPILEKGFEIDFRARFNENLEKMDNTQLCFLVDSIGRVSEDHRISIFGSMANEPAAYHAINGVISKAYGVSLVFDVFGRGNKRRFEKLEVQKLDRNLLVSAIKVYCKLYFYLLEGLTEAILSLKEEELPKKTLTYAISKKLGPYFEVIDEQHKLLRQKGKKGGDTMKFMVDRILVDLDDEEDD